MKVLRQRIYSIYALLIFGIGFLLLLPFFILIIFVKPLKKYTGTLNYVWAKLFFTLIFIPVKVTYQQKLSRRERYIFCANHFSYLDIPVMGCNKIAAIFMGKNEMEKWPLFGFMYKNLHITVDRESLKSRYSTYVKTQEAIDNGFSITIFPEGGMLTKSPPQMVRFKDGAFKIAVEKQKPLVPVTIPYNWIILPDDGRFLLKFRRPHVIFHTPIQTTGKTLDDISDLKEQVYQVIDSELKKVALNEGG